MPRPPRFSPHLPATPTEVAEFPPRCRRISRSASSTLGRSLSLFHGGRNHQSSSPAASSRNCNSRSRLIVTHCAWLVRSIGFGRPRPALLPAQPLLQVAEPVLLPEPRREQLHHLQPRQLHRRGHQGEPLLVPLDLGDDRLDRHLPAQHAPQADDLLPADLPLPAVDEGAAGLPRPVPQAAPAGRLQPPAPLGLRPPLPLGALLRGGTAKSRASCRNRVRKSIRGAPPRAGPAAGPRSAGRSRRRRRPGACPVTIRACSRSNSTASSHLVRNATVPPGPAGNCDLRK